MENYRKLCRELLEDAIEERITYDGGLTRREVLENISENGTEDIFGNMTGSRTCNTYEAQKFIDDAGAIWDEDIHQLFEEMGEDYFSETLKRGPETLDVVILELLSYQVIDEMLTEEDS